MHVACYGGGATVIITILGYVNPLMEWGAANRFEAGCLISGYFGLYVIRYGFERDRRELQEWRDNAGWEDADD